MRYWWVNQNQTYRQEVSGGYLWSPKRNKNGHRNPFYEFMREVSPGDLVFSYCGTRVVAVGIANSYCYESPKPTEFGTIGANWEAIGWKVDVTFRELQNRVRPKDVSKQLAPFLGDKYAPLQRSGDGLQSVYLAEISAGFAATLTRLIGPEARSLQDAASAVAIEARQTPAPEPTLEEWERREEARIAEAPNIPETERRALVLARRGQGVFHNNVREVERACRVTRVDRPEHLVASHIQPWRHSDNEARLAGENGLMLTPTVDHLFDKGFISFEGGGRLIVSPVADRASLVKMGIDPSANINVGSFSQEQRRFLEFHREVIFKEAAIRR